MFSITIPFGDQENWNINAFKPSIITKEFNMEEKTTPGFLGTYFNKDAVLKIVTAARVFAWIIACFYTAQWLLQMGTYFLQLIRGYWTGMGFTDIAQNLLWLFEQPLRGLVYFVVLQGVAQVLLMVMDIEDNTRRSARE